MLDEAVTAGVKNSILIGLIILILHVLLRNAQDPLSSSWSSERFTAPAPSAPLPPPPGAPRETRPTATPSGAKLVAAPPALDSTSDSDLLEYVYGSASGPAAVIEVPKLLPSSDLAAPQSAPSASKKLTKTKLPDTAINRADAPPNLIAAYADENAMCGGALFGGASGLLGFDGASACYAPAR